MTGAAKRGAFILFEGIDRCGKTTQATRLLEHLQTKNAPVEMWRFPDRTTVLGKMIDSYLKSDLELDDAAVHLLFAANRWEKKNSLLRALQAGTNLVVDRYSYSGIAYTSAKAVDGLDLKWCREPEQGLPAPDLVLYMKMSPEASAKRGGYGEERYEKAEMQSKVSNIFESLSDDRWVVIDADQPIDVIQKQVAEAVDAALSKISEDTPILTLWGYTAQAPNTADVVDGADVGEAEMGKTDEEAKPSSPKNAVLGDATNKIASPAEEQATKRPRVTGEGANPVQDVS